MLRSRFFFVAIGILGWAAPLDAQPIVNEVLAASQRIDELIGKRAKDDGIPIASPADDATFIRRLSLDLLGRIPDLIGSRDFVESEDLDKRWVWVEKYLSNPRHSRHFAAVYRNILLPQSSNRFGINFQGSFELFLKERLERNFSYDLIVREILTRTPDDKEFERAINNQEQSASNLAFFLAGEGKAEELAATTARVVLGVKLECAQCHAHPFASWSKDQFWEFAAFFNVNYNLRFFAGPGGKAKPFEITIPGTPKTVKAKFLDGVQPKAEGHPLTVMADWATSPSNPYFARAAADHLWSYFFGVSLLEPVLEQADDDAVAHPELLDFLAKELVDHQFDVKYLIRAIVHTNAYRRTSEGQGSPQDARYFTRMPVRGMTAEQFFDSFCEATGYAEKQVDRAMDNRPGLRPATTPRQEFLAKFATTERRHETHTSIQQALFVMNGKFVHERTRVESNESLRTLVESKRQTTEQKLATMFLMTLSRLPRPDEIDRFASAIDRRTAQGEVTQAWSDLFWVLLNSAEFRLNH